MRRRAWIRETTVTALGMNFLDRLYAQADPAEFPPCRIITRGPRHHWFGYYDKWQFDPTDRFVLGMEVDFEHRSPTADDVIRIGMVDLENDDEWTELGECTAWGWQQGCMLQWIGEKEVLWNDREADRYVCRILNVETRELRTVPQPVYSVSPDGKTAVTADFRRINDVRPGYGYVGLPDPHAGDLAPGNTGIFRVDLETGTSDLIVSIDQIAGLGEIPNPDPKAKHYFNHLLFNPDGSRFVFLHRWRYPKGNRLTRMFTAAPDGSEVRVVDDNGLTSHFIWRDRDHILAFSEQPSAGKRFYLFEDGGDESVEVVGGDELERDGHCSYLPGGEWILNDTYPDQDRNQMPHLFHISSGKVVPLGLFHSPEEYTGEWRCDTHPRVSRNGKRVTIDSPVEGQGRQMHLIDISGIVE